MGMHDMYDISWLTIVWLMHNIIGVWTRQHQHVHVCPSRCGQRGETSETSSACWAYSNTASPHRAILQSDVVGGLTSQRQRCCGDGSSTITLLAHNLAGGNVITIGPILCAKNHRLIDLVELIWLVFRLQGSSPNNNPMDNWFYSTADLPRSAAPATWLLGMTPTVSM
jgi:hypothetical protein